VFPLASGNGTYTIGVFRNISGNQFSTDFSITTRVTISDEFAPFLRPNQFVNYNENTLAVVATAELVSEATTPLEKIEIIYNFVTSEFSYDTALATSVQSGYVPDLDRVWNARKGICFCFASITAAMLRSQGIPTKLVFGYVREVYHAWISVWTEETGWIDSTIFFDGEKWILMDPTFRAGASSSQSLARFIGDGSRYTVRFVF
jgi:transglutaminase-like putative cysteine protease